MLTPHSFCLEPSRCNHTQLEGWNTATSREKGSQQTSHRQRCLNGQENQGEYSLCISTLGRPVSVQNWHHFRAHPSPRKQPSAVTAVHLLLQRSRALPALLRFELLVPESLPVSNLTLRSVVTPQTYLVSPFLQFLVSKYTCSTICKPPQAMSSLLFSSGGRNAYFYRRKVYFMLMHHHTSTPQAPIFVTEHRKW